ncbi:unnamed protein product [Somion occarium]|uniref:BTB domain-containing protein n=1 Tax=Somion occarium TaxID=3059160 RepID=A0ABP1DJB8_9APHY
MLNREPYRRLFTGDNPNNDVPGNDESQNLADNFQFDDADIIIRAGGVDFQAHKFILSHVSPIFKDMFSLPGNQTSQKGVPIIELVESAQVIHDLLSMLYHSVNDPDFNNLNDIHRLLLALRKYDVEKICMRVAKQLEAKAAESPGRVFYIAMSSGLVDDVARTAAWHMLSQNIFDLATTHVPEYNQFHVGTFQQLLRYHVKCGDVAKEQCSNLRPQGLDWIWLQCRTSDCKGSFSDRFPDTSDDRLLSSRNQHPSVKRWWLDYISALGERLKVQPLGIDYSDEGFLKKYADGASKCSICGPPAMYQLTKFNEGFEKQVRAAIENVPLELDEDDFLL